MKNIQVGGRCLQFDGVNDLVEIPAYQPITEEFTISFWAKFETPIDSHGWILTNRTGTGDGFSVFLLNRSTLNYDFGGSGNRWNTGFIPPWGEWVHLTLTRSGSGRSLYVNGELFATTSAGGNLESVHTSSSLFIGQALNSNFIKGNMSYMQLWNRVLSESEIKGFMDSEPTGTEEGLVGYWKLVEGSGTVAYDSTANGQDGTIAGGANWVDGILRNIDRIEVMSGGKLTPVIGKVMTSEGLKDFYRPINLETDFRSKQHNMSLYNAQTKTSEAVRVGDTSIPVHSTNGFYAGRVVTITDGVNREDVKVFAVGVNQLTVSPLTNGYARNALLARTTSLVAGNGIQINTLGSYSVRQMLFLDDFDTMRYSASSTTVHSVNASLLNVTATSTDPMIHMENIGSFDPASARYIHMKYRILSGGTTGWELFFTNDKYPGAHGEHNLQGGVLSADGQWHTAVIDGWGHPGWKTNGNIRGWRLDWATSNSINMEIDYVALTT